MAASAEGEGEFDECKLWGGEEFGEYKLHFHPIISLLSFFSWVVLPRWVPYRHNGERKSLHLAREGWSCCLVVLWWWKRREERWWLLLLGWWWRRSQEVVLLWGKQEGKHSKVESHKVRVVVVVHLALLLVVVDRVVRKVRVVVVVHLALLVVVDRVVHQCREKEERNPLEEGCNPLEEERSRTQVGTVVLSRAIQEGRQIVLPAVVEAVVGTAVEDREVVVVPLLVVDTAVEDRKVVVVPHLVVDTVVEDRVVVVVVVPLVVPVVALVVEVQNQWWGWRKKCPLLPYVWSVGREQVRCADIQL